MTMSRLPGRQAMRYPNNREKALTQARLPRVLSQPSYRAVTCSYLGKYLCT